MEPIDYGPIAGAFAGYRSGSVTDVVLGLAVVADELKPLDGKFVLDYGCGDGSFCRMLRNSGAWVTGVDVSPEMIERAREQDAEGINYVVSESARLAIADASVDAVTFNFVLSSMARREDIAATLAEAHRVLKPRGTVAVLTVNWELANGKEFLTFALDHFPSLVSGAKVGGVLKGTPPLHVRDYYWSMADHRALLQEAGFVVTKTLEPLAEDESHPWKAERTVPPFMIFFARKVV